MLHTELEEENDWEEGGCEFMIEREDENGVKQMIKCTEEEYN